MRHFLLAELLGQKIPLIDMKIGASHIGLNGCTFDMKSIGTPLVTSDSDNRYLFIFHGRLGGIN